MQYHQLSITSQSQLVFTLDHVISQRSEVIVNKSHIINSVQKHVVIIIIQLKRRRSSWLWMTQHCEYRQYNDYEWFRAKYTYRYDYSVNIKHDTKSKIQEAKYTSCSNILLNLNLSKKILKLISVDRANRFKQDLSKIWARFKQDIWVRRFSNQQVLTKKINLNKIWARFEQDLSKIWAKYLSKIWARYLSKIWAKYLSKKILKSTKVNKANKFEQDLSKIWARYLSKIWVRSEQEDS